MRERDVMCVGTERQQNTQILQDACGTERRKEKDRGVKKEEMRRDLKRGKNRVGGVFTH